MLPSDIWPPSGLTIASGALRLAPMTPETGAELIRRTRGTATVFPDPDVAWAFPWLEGTAAQSARHMLAMAASPGTPDWTLGLAAVTGGEVAGAIDLRVASRGGRRFLETGSYLLAGFHGRGLGTAMRRAAMALAFDHLGAEELWFSAHPDNAASLAVGRRCGYARVGGVDDSGPFPVEHHRVTPETADYGGGRVVVDGWTPELAALLPLP
ncbi:GNAT family N-acetyltransferase [Corynebacterium sp. 335C]